MALARLADGVNGEFLSNDPSLIIEGREGMVRCGGINTGDGKLNGEYCLEVALFCGRLLLDGEGGVWVD